MSRTRLTSSEPDQGSATAARFMSDILPRRTPPRICFDIVIVGGVLHPMTYEDARTLFSTAARVLKPGGRVVSLDNIYVDNQNPIARFIISRDRGQNVRTPEGYRALATNVFDHVIGDVVKQSFPPYTFWIMTASQS